MKLYYFFQFLLAFIFSLFFSINSFSQNQTPRSVTGLGSVKGYLEYLPADYNSNTDAYPVIIFLHGSGERGDGSASSLELVKRHGPPKHIKNNHQMCFTVENTSECFIVLSPQQGTSQFGWNKDVVPFVDYAIANYRIDPDRIYLTGLSMGGDGCWDGMRSDFNETNRFAAVAPIAGKGMSSEGCTAGERGIVIWAFHGDADTATPINSHLQAINGFIDCVQAPNPEPIFTIYEGVGHAKSWQNAYKTDNSLHTPNLYQWFLTQNRSQQVLSIADVSDPLPLKPGDQIVIYSILGQTISNKIIKDSKETIYNHLKKEANDRSQLYLLQIIKPSGLTSFRKIAL